MIKNFVLKGLFFVFFTAQFSCNNPSIVIKGGTTTISVFTQDTVWIASDSRHTQTDLRYPQTTYTNVCKIRIRGDVFYTLTGNMTSVELNDVTLVNGEEIMDNALLKFNDVNKAFNFFSDTVNSLLYKSCLIEHKMFPDKFKNMYNKLLMQVVLVSFRNGSPLIRTRKYILTPTNDSNTFQVVMDNTNEAFAPILPYWLSTGYSDSIKSYMSNNPRYFYKGVTKDNLEKLVQMECIAHPEGVGEPIDIIAIFNGGYNWLQVKKLCD